MIAAFIGGTGLAVASFMLLEMASQPRQCKAHNR